MTWARTCRIPAALDEVTHRSGAEVEPQSVGLSRQGVESIWRAVEALYRTGTHPGISLCVLKRGQVVLERALGHLSGNGPDDVPDVPRRPLKADSPFCVFSVSKAVTAMLVHHLDGRGLLHIDDPVAEYIPEFGRHGKGRVTIRHVLTHRAGIPSVAGAANDPDMLGDWDRVVRLLCDARPTFAPGRRLAYHAITGGYVLGEIVARVTGRDLRQLVRSEIADPLGMTWFNYGVRPDQVGEVARNAFTGPPVPPGVSHLVRRALGVSFADAVAISNDPRYLTPIVPSGNLVATAGEIATFFEVLRNDGTHRGIEIFDRRTVRRALAESSYLEVDLTLAFPVRYGLGLMLGAEHFSLFGPRSADAFGHLGFIHVLGWADPRRETSVALLTSGKPFVGAHLVRLVELVRAIATHTE